MSWNSARSLEEVRLELLERMAENKFSVRSLCRQYGISTKTAYKWKKRKESGCALTDQSRRPKCSPTATSPETVAKIIELRKAHPTLGGAKISIMLRRRGLAEVPAGPTITDILRRNNLLNDRAVAEARHLIRFAKDAPNEMWQVDFKGHFRLSSGERCHPLNVIDDFSRYALVSAPLLHETFEAVKPVFVGAFREYGLPATILCDNGNPWGVSQKNGITLFEAWAMELDVLVVHGRPLHPQTQGKEERFNKTWKRELLDMLGSSPDILDVTSEAEFFRRFYNEERPHFGIGGKVPADLYRKSERRYPETVSDWEYQPGQQVRYVNFKGYVTGEGWHAYIGESLRNKKIATVASQSHPDCVDLLFRNFRIGRLNLVTGHLDYLRIYRIKGDPRSAKKGE